MSTKKIKERHSFVDENGQRWLQCKYCYEYQKVEPEVGAVTCSSCVLKRTLVLKPMDEFFAKKHKKTGRPPGWHFMNEFVDKDCNVFHKGVEQSELKGTLEPSKVKPRKKKKKLTEEEKLQRDLKNWNKRKRARRGKK